LYVFAKELEVCEKEDANFISFEGYVCRKGDLRITPLGKKRILDLMIATNRKSKKSSYIPCIVWGLTEESSKNISVGEKIRLDGRIQSREYQKVLESGTVETRIAYEVSVNQFSKCKSK